MVHALVHSNENPDKCPHCGKVFTSRGSLTRHIQVHSGESPYKCIFCAKRFTQSCNLDKQVRIHSGERSYKCSTCEKAFTQSSHLVSHMRIHSKTFGDISLLEQHLSTHCCNCSQCQKTCASQKKLDRRNANGHSLKSPFNYDLCPRSFLN
ncbi:zinc finger protein 93-like [Drosophila nasuta]|uniref:zinc finger protein 93-like n=1 Tax=Drosophila nasuta TaxID=42062 RepID=UPI00295E9B79|nr:zinc finger protein 93-like [Drosophila nasuta]